MNKEMPLHEMTQYRERLIRQKEFLSTILSKIEKQILALQVERLHLRNTLLGSDYSRRKDMSDVSRKETKMDLILENLKSLGDQDLDLTVPSFLNNSEEETEDEEKL